MRSLNQTVSVFVLFGLAAVGDGLISAQILLHQNPPSNAAIASSGSMQAAAAIHAVRF